MTRLLAAQRQLVVYLTGEMSHTPLFQPKMQQSTSSSKKLKQSSQNLNMIQELVKLETKFAELPELKLEH
jgi:hypothetical protein